MHVSSFLNAYSLSLPALVLLTACHQSPQSSKLRDLTDEEETRPGLAARMIWLDSDQPGSYVLARCLANKEVVRENCKAYRHASRAEVLNGLFEAQKAALDTLRSERSSIIHRVHRNHPKVKNFVSAIEGLQNAISSLELQIDDLQLTEKAKYQSDLKQMEERLQDKRKQLDALEQLLAQQPNNSNLLIQKEQRLAELELTELEKSDTEAQINRINQRVEQLSRNIEDRERLIDRQESLMIGVMDLIQVTDLDIEAINAKIRAVERIGSSFEPLLNIIDSTPGYSYRLYDLQGDLLPAGRYLFSSLSLWASSFSYDFASAQELPLIPSPWSLKNEGATNYIATAMGDAYDASLDTTLELNPITMGAGNELKVSIRHRFDTEAVLDYGTLEYLAPSGSWLPVTPPFTGSQLAWKEEEFFLQGLDGLMEIKLRLRFASDTSVSGKGWDIDFLRFEVQ